MSSQQKAPKKKVAPEGRSDHKPGWRTPRKVVGGEPEGNVFSKLRDTRETNPTIKKHGKAAGRERGKEWVVKQEQRMVAWINSSLGATKVGEGIPNS